MTAADQNAQTFTGQPITIGRIETTEFGDGGVYVSEEPHLTFLKDTDGDLKADVKELVFTGFSRSKP